MGVFINFKFFWLFWKRWLKFINYILTKLLHMVWFENALNGDLNGVKLGSCLRGKEFE